MFSVATDFISLIRTKDVIIVALSTERRLKSYILYTNTLTFHYLCATIPLYDHSLILFNSINISTASTVAFQFCATLLQPEPTFV